MGIRDGFHAWRRRVRRIVAASSSSRATLDQIVELLETGGVAIGAVTVGRAASQAIAARVGLAWF